MGLIAFLVLLYYLFKCSITKLDSYANNKVYEHSLDIYHQFIEKYRNQELEKQLVKDFLSTHDDYGFKIAGTYGVMEIKIELARYGYIRTYDAITGMNLPWDCLDKIKELDVELQKHGVGPMLFKEKIIDPKRPFNYKKHFVVDLNKNEPMKGIFCWEETYEYAIKNI